MSEKVSENFTEEEVACNCGCGKMDINHELLYRLEIARITANIPFYITSWNRCEDYNSKVGGSPTSSHLTSKAVDIYFRNEKEKYIIFAHLAWAGFKRIGVSDKDNFIHADVDEGKGKPSPIIWTY